MDVFPVLKETLLVYIYLSFSFVTSFSTKKKQPFWVWMVMFVSLYLQHFDVDMPN